MEPFQYTISDVLQFFHCETMHEYQPNKCNAFAWLKKITKCKPERNIRQSLSTMSSTFAPHYQVETSFNNSSQPLLWPSWKHHITIAPQTLYFPSFTITHGQLIFRNPGFNTKNIIMIMILIIQWIQWIFLLCDCNCMARHKVSVSSNILRKTLH